MTDSREDAPANPNPQTGDEEVIDVTDVQQGLRQMAEDLCAKVADNDIYAAPIKSFLNAFNACGTDSRLIFSLAHIW